MENTRYCSRIVSHNPNSIKSLTFFLCLCAIICTGKAQNIDSFFLEPQVVELSISTPQPRLRETFEVNIDISHLRANIFRSFIGQLQLSDESGTATDNSKLKMNVTAQKLGKNTIGPLRFTVNNTQYTTNQVTYEVIEPLPDTDNGLWFRVAHTSDSTFSIIIEQRIPATEKITHRENTINYSTEPETRDEVKFKSSYSIPGVQSSYSQSQTKFSSVEINGKDHHFMYAFAIYKFEIIERIQKPTATCKRPQNI